MRLAGRSGVSNYNTSEFFLFGSEPNASSARQPRLFRTVDYLSFQDVGSNLPYTSHTDDPFTSEYEVADFLINSNGHWVAVIYEYVSRLCSIYLSTNKGASWTQIQKSGPTAHATLRKPVGKGLLIDDCYCYYTPGAVHLGRLIGPLTGAESITKDVTTAVDAEFGWVVSDGATALMTTAPNSTYNYLVTFDPSVPSVVQTTPNLIDETYLIGKHATLASPYLTMNYSPTSWVALLQDATSSYSTASAYVSSDNPKYLNFTSSANSNLYLLDVNGSGDFVIKEVDESLTNPITPTEAVNLTSDALTIKSGDANSYRAAFAATNATQSGRIEFWASGNGDPTSWSMIDCSSLGLTEVQGVRAGNLLIS